MPYHDNCNIGFLSIQCHVLFTLVPDVHVDLYTKIFSARFTCGRLVYIVLYPKIVNLNFEVR